MPAFFRTLAFLLILPLLAGGGQPYAMAHHPVSTNNELAQQYFDQALTLYYAYNGAEAIPLFERAVAMDPHLAMAYYGIALASGPDLNSPLTQDGFKRAADALRKARSLENYANSPERAYIAALSTRYALEFKNREVDEARYRGAMAELASRYPGDDDALTLYIEAMLEQSGRGDLWNSDGSPRTAEVATMWTTLRTVLQRTPMHIGANHLFIHLFDSAQNPQAALPSARRLSEMNFAPAEEHLAHMPAHTFNETGNYAAAASASRQAIGLFDAYLASDHNATHDNYWSHDVGVGVTALRMLGNYRDAMHLSRRLDEHFHNEDASNLTMVRFYHWDEVLRLHPTQTSDVLRFARGMSLAATGNLGQAEKDFQALKKAKSGDAVSRDLLEAKIAIARGDFPSAEALLLRTEALDDQATTGEYPYFYPPGEALGALYFRMNQFSKAEIAFRKVLRVHPNGGRALFGLWKTLAAENKPEAPSIERQFQAAWKHNDTALDITQL
ncbi:MAG: hypothetical protein GIW98_07200 [Candidatus Eremiobacteraeota bacterium]|nr:hypothetical protein [Candidatus Eremiobacteraeota bacterium]